MFYLSLRVNLVKFENENEYDLNEKEKEGKGQERSSDERDEPSCLKTIILFRITGERKLRIFVFNLLLRDR